MHFGLRLDLERHAGMLAEGDFDAVDGPLSFEVEAYPGAGFRELDHVQVCVRSPRQIIGYFLPRQS